MEDLIERIKRNEKQREKDITERGVQKGIREEKIETARKLKLRNMSINEILEITGLTRNEILKIK